MRRTLLAAAAGALAFACAPSAAAAPSWVPRTFGHVAATGHVDVNARGEAIAAYDSAEYGLGAVIHRPGGEWEPLAVPRQVGSACGVRAAIDDAGVVTMVWIQATDDVCGPGRVYAASLPAGASVFGPAQPISPVGSFGQLTLAADSAGAIVAAWVRSDGEPLQPVILEAAVRPAGGTFGAAEDVARLDGMSAVDGIRLAVGPTGAMAAVWRTAPAGEGYASLGLAVRDPGFASWGSDGPGFGGGEAGVTTAAVAFDGGSGDLLVLWGEASTNPQASVCGTATVAPNAVCAVRRTAGRVWQPRQIIATPAVAPGGMTADGGPARTVALWREADVVRAGSRPNGAESVWSLQYVPATDPPSPIGAADEIALDVGPSGGALAIWKSDNGYNEASMTRDGAWTPPATFINTPGYLGETIVALDAADNAVVAIHPSQFEFDALVRDASGPDIVLSAPSSAVTGQPVSLSIRALDRWLPLAGVPSVDFGDGTPAATTTAHVYAAPGTYTIRVTQADTIGNIGTATHVVTVTAPVPGPPVHAPPPAAAARTPSIGLATARFAVAWRASVARGHLVLQGTSTRTAIVTGALIRPGFRKPLRFGVATGAWTARIPVPRRMLPGRYQLVLDGEPAAEVAAVIGRGIRLAAPPEGIVADHRVSSSRGGPDAISFTRPRALHVVLRFAALPRFGLPLRLDIHGPNGYRDRRDHRRRATVGAVVTNEGARLARGRWQFTLRAGPTVVKRVAVLVR